MDLTKQELGTLIEALSDWESAPSTKGLTSGMIGMMLSKGKDVGRAAMEEAAELAKEEGDKRKETAICLKAKLITHKNSL